MSTNATITIKSNDKFHTLYVHWDGYIEHTGKMLLNHYSNQTVLDEMIELGNISFLDSTLENTKFYGRDMGRLGEHAQVDSSLSGARLSMNQEYNYYWDGERWYYVSGKVMIPLVIKEI